MINSARDGESTYTGLYGTEMDASALEQDVSLQFEQANNFALHNFAGGHARQTPLGSEYNFDGNAIPHGENCVCITGTSTDQASNPEFDYLSPLDTICQNNVLKTQIIDMREQMDELQEKNNKILPELNR